MAPLGGGDLSISTPRRPRFLRISEGSKTLEGEFRRGNIACRETIWATKRSGSVGCGFRSRAGRARQTAAGGSGRLSSGIGIACRLLRVRCQDNSTRISMEVLVDYDNVEPLERRRGLVHVITRILSAIPPSRFPARAEARVRLYGGWFFGVSSSRRAQELAPDLDAEFPRRIAVTDVHSAVSVLVRVELAMALECDPQNPLTHTFRRRSAPEGVRCVMPPFARCQTPGTCPLESLHVFLGQRACPYAACAVTPDDLLAKEEQKLVDTLLTTDLAYFAISTKKPVVVVSADDDMWPAIRFGLLRGLEVIHVLPRRSMQPPQQYRMLMTSSYASYSF